MKEIFTLRLDSETKEKLELLSKSMDRTKSYVAAEAIREYIRLNEWHIQAINKGISQADRGDMVSHETVKAKWEKMSGNKMD